MIKVLNNERGTLLASFVIILSVLTSILLYAASASLANRLGIERTYQKTVALNIAEGGVEKALWNIKQGIYTSESDSTDIPGGQFDYTITGSGNIKTIIATGYVPSKANPKYIKKLKVKVTDQPAIYNTNFGYAIQAGEGGIHISGNAEVNGSLYSNGIIELTNAAAKVRNPGDVWAVGEISDIFGGIAGTKTSPADYISLPELDLNAWRSIAHDGGVITGNYSPPNDGMFTDLGPVEITGNVTMSKTGQKINLKGPVYIHGDLDISGGTWQVDSGFGDNGTVVLVDGKINITAGTGKSSFQSSSEDAYILFVSASTANTQGDSAISFTGSATAEKLVLYAYYGSMLFSGSGDIIAMTGETLYLTGGGEINYKSGLASGIFASGPGGVWKIIEWQEIK
ncbi:MAG: hypothetical protein AAB632_00520 [Patescibacteria group bacterium]